MTIAEQFCSQIILQKSLNVTETGPAKIYDSFTLSFFLNLSISIIILIKSAFSLEKPSNCRISFKLL